MSLTGLLSFLYLVSNMHGAFPPHFPIFGYRSSDRSLRLQWDSRGVTGGCQDMYTVIPNSSATAQNPASCTNVTFPHPPLQVAAAVSGGAFSQYGWVPQVRWWAIACIPAMNGLEPFHVAGHSVRIFKSRQRMARDPIQ